MRKKLNLAAFLILLSFCNFTIAKTYKIAFGSCLDQEDPQPIWNAVKGENINSFIFLGDNVYGDVPSGSLDFGGDGRLYKETATAESRFYRLIKR